MRINYNRFGDSLVRMHTMRQARMKSFSQGRKLTKSSGTGNHTIKGGKAEKNNLDTLLKKLQSSEKNQKNKLLTSTEAQKKEYYAAVDTYAGKITTHAKKLLDTEKDSLFEKAKTAVAERQNAEKMGQVVSEESQKAENALYDEIVDFVSDYNSMVKNMSKLGDTENAMYLRQLNVYFGSNRVSLGNIGIKAGSDGILVLNEKKLREADLKDVQSVFGMTKGYLDKVAGRTTYIESSAERNLKKMTDAATQKSSNYNKYGTSDEENDSWTGIYNRLG